MNMKAIRKMKDESGFTLVELMIVVAIIGILAAIAIPQFAAYRARSFNSSAVSDIRGLATSQATFFGDNSLYGVTSDGTTTPGAIILTGDAVTGPGTATDVITQWARGAARTLQIPVGSGVVIAAKVDAAAISFTGISKHTSGQNWYGIDGDTTAVYVAIGDETDQGVAAVLADCPASAVGTDQIDTIAVTTGTKPKFTAM